MDNANVEPQEGSTPAAMEAPEKRARSSSSNIDLLLDVAMRVTVELGRTRMKLAQILELQVGSVIELDRLAGDPVDILVNDHMVARGEVVVVEDKFGVRIIEMIASSGEKARA